MSSLLSIGVDELVQLAEEEQESREAASTLAKSLSLTTPLEGSYGYVPASDPEESPGPGGINTRIGAGTVGSIDRDSELSPEVDLKTLATTTTSSSPTSSPLPPPLASPSSSPPKAKKGMSLTAAALMNAAARSSHLRVDDVSETEELLFAIQELVVAYPPLYASTLSNARLTAFGVKPSDSLRTALSSVKAVINAPQPLSALEGVYLALLLTTNLDGVDRIPMTLISVKRGESFISRFLILRFKGKYGLTGQSVVPEGSSELFNIIPSHDTLPLLLQELINIFQHISHAVARVHYGLPVPHDLHRRLPVEWKYLSLAMADEPVDVTMERVRMFNSFVEAMTKSRTMCRRKTMEESDRVDLINCGFHLLSRNKARPPRKRAARRCEGYRVIKVVKGIVHGEWCSKKLASELDAETEAVTEAARSSDEIHTIVKRLTSSSSRVRLNEYRQCECSSCVQYLPPRREHISLQPSSPTRASSATVSAPSGKSTTRLVSYNVLSAYNSHPDDYDYCPRDIFDWAYRAPRLLVEILGYDPDILCLQDLDEAGFLDVFEPRLAEVGYDGLFKASSTGDGVAIFYRSSVYTAVAAHAVNVSELASIKSSSLARNDQASSLYAKVANMHHHNVGLVVLLRETTLDTSTQTDRIIAVSNLHLVPLYMDPEGIDSARIVQTTQMTLFLEELDRILREASTGSKALDWPQILCGDFGSHAVDGPASLLKSQFPLSHPFPVNDLPHIISESQDVTDMYGPFVNAYVDALSLETATAHIRDIQDEEGSLPFYSAWGPDGKHLFDHIFFSSRHFRLSSLVGLPVDPSIRLPLPNQHQGSEHNALVVDLSNISNQLVSHS